MLTSIFSLLALVGSTLATPLTNGTFKHPLTKPVFQVQLLAALPYNTTIPGGGTIAAVPNRGGSVSGIFEGEIIGNLTAAIETVLPAEEGEYSRWENQLVFTNEADERILVSISGTITYANEALHGFGFAYLQTTIPELVWTNYATFLVEWMADFYTGTGDAEIFEINSGGRLDGKPIAGLLPPGEE
ncbi:uncharacterized protein BDV14DRAFT_106344 [Aspergillus stella-maris]|uniref:uncharacterized protein n=1 Tax=Aspergillus stella-maris TaxID=1810926 RepID=UPI003CCDF86B